jgi:sugar fermentation stimulation protein A
MLFPQPLKRGILIRRYKRFLADVLLEGEDCGPGVETTVHTPNPGAMLGLCKPGMTVWCSHSGSATRKLPLTWELVEADGGAVGINTMLANRLVAEALEADAIAALHGYTSIRREVKYGAASRVDFLLEHPDRSPCWLEVKSVTLLRGGGLAEFPDCVSERGARHLHELQAKAQTGERAVMLFVVQRADCDRFDIARDIDPAYGAAMSRALEAGVEVLAYSCAVGPMGVSITRPIPLV